MKKKLKQNVMNIFYLYSLLGVVAILSRMFSETNVHFEWLVRENLTRSIVPVIFLLASFSFFRNKELDLKNLKRDYFEQLRFGIEAYLIYTGLFIISNLVRSDFSWWWKDILKIYIFGGAPCAWMILSFIIGLGMIIVLRSFSVSIRNILLISFILYLFSISSEVYFELVYGSGALKKFFEDYSRYCITSRNGFFYGFFWCTVGFVFANIKIGFLKTIRFKMIMGMGIFLMLMIGEHYYAFLNNWPRDYKSSFMIIPLSICTFLFLKSYDLKHISEFSKHFKNIIFISFMLCPSVDLVFGYIYNGNPLIKSSYVALILVGVSGCLYFVVFKSKLNFNLFS